MMDHSQLKRAFELFDHNGDGNITKQELYDSLKNMGIDVADADLVQIMDKIDVNGDGHVDLDEFKAMYGALMDEKDEEPSIREAFNVFDKNGDGFISVEELSSVLMALGLKQGKTKEECKKMISKVDVDGDGMVDFAEFKQMMKGGAFVGLEKQS